MLRRFLDGPMEGVEEILFAVRVPGRDHWYANFGNYASDTGRGKARAFKRADGVYWAYGEGGRLCRLNLRTGRLTVLLDDPKGGVRDPHVHYDGRTILFSYRKGGTHPYHLHELRADAPTGSPQAGLRQLTDGPDDDIEPVYLPCGDIAFVSSRCRRFVPCWHTRVGILYRCDPDGGNIRMLSSNVEHENTPWVLRDGRLVYTRWEYVDRNQNVFHHLWTVNPDGTAAMVLFGNQHPGTAMLDAKPIPGTNRVVASFSPGHGRPEHMGHITIVDPGTGPDNRAATTRLSRRMFRDPYAFSQDCFLVADGRGIHVMDGRGRTELVYALPKGQGRLACHEPRPLRPRPREPVVPDRVDPAAPTGRLVLLDIHKGRNMRGVKRGEIKKLLVLEQLPKPVNFAGGQEPLTIGGTFCLERIVGTVPVEPDGSAYMEVPALRSLFFVALDGADLSVKRMQSFLTVMPGETTGCVGCHEDRVYSPHEKPDPLALRRPPSRVQPIRGVPDVLDYPRDVQPILDRHCVRCHNPHRPDGRVDLCGDRTPGYSISYWTMMTQGLISDGRNTRHSNLPPRAIGSVASKLLGLIDGSHHQAALSPHERTVVRLWIESGAVYPGTYAALGSGMSAAQLPVQTIVRRCASCHRGKPRRSRRASKGTPYLQFGKGGPARPLIRRPTIRQVTRVCWLAYYQFGEAGSHQSLCNLSHPRKSLLLLAPLARAAGGLERCAPTVFADAADPDYKEILASIRGAADRLRQTKRFDMPGFRPNRHYVREMQRFGILPTTLKPTDPVDPYATDRAYWRSFYPSPRAASAGE